MHTAVVVDHQRGWAAGGPSMGGLHLAARVKVLALLTTHITATSDTPGEAKLQPRHDSVHPRAAKKRRVHGLRGPTASLPPTSLLPPPRRTGAQGGCPGTDGCTLPPSVGGTEISEPRLPRHGTTGGRTIWTAPITLTAGSGSAKPQVSAADGSRFAEEVHRCVAPFQVAMNADGRVGGESGGEESAWGRRERHPAPPPQS